MSGSQSEEELAAAWGAELEEEGQEGQGAAEGEGSAAGDHGHRGKPGGEDR